MIKRLLQKVRHKYLKLTARTFASRDSDNNRYYQIQQNQTLAKITKDARFRYERIIGHLLPFIPDNDRPLKKVVCVGCRNIYELREFQKQGFNDVNGIDLVSIHPDILVMDMHDLKFPDRSVDVIYSADSLEHAHDPAAAAQQFLRVIKPNGIICLSVPIEWRKALNKESVCLADSADCQDYISREQVLEFFASGNPQVLFEEMYKAPDGSNNWLAIMRIKQSI